MLEAEFDDIHYVLEVSLSELACASYEGYLEEVFLEGFNAVFEELFIDNLVHKRELDKAAPKSREEIEDVIFTIPKGRPLFVDTFFFFLLKLLEVIHQETLHLIGEGYLKRRVPEVKCTFKYLDYVCLGQLTPPIGDLLGNNRQEIKS